MSNGDDTLTHKDLAQALGVSETTIKSYRRKFPLYFPLHSQGKPLRFKPQALEVAKHIRQGFLADLSVEEIRSSLDDKFQRVATKRIHSSLTDTTPPPANQPDPSWKAIENVLTNVLQAQQYANQRLDALQELLADFLSLHLSREDAFSQGLGDLQRILNRHLQRLDEVASQTPPHEHSAPQQPPQENGPKRVTVRNIYGQSTEYEIHSDPKEPHGLSSSWHPEEQVPEQQGPHSSRAPATALTPPESLLAQPLVVRTGAGEYLGVAGKAEGAFCLNDLLDLVHKAHPAPLHFRAAWSQSPENAERYRLELEQEEAIRPRVYVLEVEPARTPRGNLVTILVGFETQGSEMPPANIYAFIRQMKQQI